VARLRARERDKTADVPTTAGEVSAKLNVSGRTARRLVKLAAKRGYVAEPELVTAGRTSREADPCDGEVDDVTLAELRERLEAAESRIAELTGKVDGLEANAAREDDGYPDWLAP
jgi:hypothetical protein